MQKVVGFYRPVVVDDKENRIDIKDFDFWVKAHKLIEVAPYTDRRMNVNTSPFHGEAGIGKAPATRYIRIGRVRTAADWPNTIDDQQQATAPLALPNGQNLFEAAYLVPFGAVNRVAFMGPMRGIVTVRSVETWLGAMLDLPKKGHRIELLPEVDASVAQKLTEAEGVTRLRVRVPVGSGLDLPSGERTGAELALDNAVSVANEELSAELVLSAGHGRASAKMRSKLKTAALRLLRAHGVDKLEVTLATIDEETKRLRTEQHDLIRDIITATVKFDVDDHTQLSTDAVLAGVQKAIVDFQSRG